MAKNVISQSNALIHLRNSYHRRNIIESILIGIGVVLLWLIYVFLYASAYGYQDFSFYPLNQWSFFKFLAYPDLHGAFFDFGHFDNLMRFVIAIIVLAVAVAAAFIYHFFHTQRLQKKYKNEYFKFLVEEAKINGITLSCNKEANISEEELNKTMELLSIYEPSKMQNYQLSTPMFSWDGIQYKYVRDGKKRDAFMISADLTKTRSHGFVQLRTFGEPSIKQYDGLPIKQYGFGDILKLASFVCYTSLGQDIYLIIDQRVANALSTFYQFVKCDLVVMVIGHKLTIFIDGFQMKLVHSLNEKIPHNILESEAEALIALHQGVSAIESAFSGEVSFASEEKGNGIIPY
ncbi:MAG: hypothetical protein PHW22_01110 [Bacilli bacterium]|nr:hypothetical protein [Bacilli bacterium]